jgi:hypothetical protein
LCLGVGNEVIKVLKIDKFEMLGSGYAFKRPHM